MVSIAAIPNRMQGTSVQTNEFPDKLPIGTMTTPPDDTSLDLKQNWAGGHTQMPNEVRNDPSLSPKAKITYEQLISYMWFHKDHCWPGQEELADKTGYSVRSIKRAVKELYERGYIEIKQRGMGETNRYYLNPLSFARSFRPISGPRTDYRMPHEQVFQAQSPALRVRIDDVTPRPVEPMYKEVPNWHQRSDSVAPQEVTEWPSKHTKTNPSKNESNKVDSRSGSAAELGVGECSPATIRSTKTLKTKSTKQTETKSKNLTVLGNGRAECVEEVKTSKRKKHAKGERPPALPIYVEEAVKQIGLRFCDQSPKSSATSVAWSCGEMRQRGVNEYDFAAVIDNVRDITISMTPTIQARNPDGSIAQMRYFLSILEKNVDAWCKQYDEAIAQQTESVAEQQNEALQVSGPSENVVQEEPQGQQLTPTSPEPISIEEVAPAPPEPIMALEQNQPELAVTSISIEEQISTGIVLPSPLATDNPKHGWSEQNAQWNADRLRDYLGSNIYSYVVVPTRCPGRYGFVIRDVRTGSTWAEIFTQDQVMQHRQRR